MLTPTERTIIHQWFQDKDPIGRYYRQYDNCRFAHKGNLAEEVEYSTVRSESGGRLVDVELLLGDGTVLMFGFNYGHANG